MSDHRPPPHSAGDDDITPPRGTRRGTRRNAAREPHRDDWHDEDDEDWDEPNYLVRRALTIGAGVAVIALVAVVASRIIEDGTESRASSEAARWNTIVAISDDEIRLIDPDNGEETGRYDAPAAMLDAQTLVAGHTLVTLTDDGRVTQTDLTDGSERRGRAADDATMRISPDNPSIALIGSELGGDVSVVDTVNRDVVSIADVTDLDDPLIFAPNVHVNAAGTHVAAPVPTLFQSFVIDLVEQTSTALAGRVIAIDNDRVVTEQPAGDRAELEFYDLTGERQGSVDVPAPEASMLTADGSMLLVARDGTIHRADAENTDEIGEVLDTDGLAVVIDGGGAVAGGDRLLAISDSTVFVIDTSGKTIAATDGRLALSPNSDARCIAVATAGDSNGVVVIDLETGATLAEVEEGFALAASFDGCHVATSGRGASLIITADETIDLESSNVAGLAPDGRVYLQTTARSRSTVELVEVGSEPDADTVDVGDRTELFSFAQL